MLAWQKQRIALHVKLEIVAGKVGMLDVSWFSLIWKIRPFELACKG